MASIFNGNSLATDPSQEVGLSIGSLGRLYEDMNASTGGVNRGTNVGTSYTTVYSFSGSGLFYGFLLTLQDDVDEHIYRLRFDGTTCFEIDGEDLDSISRYNIDRISDQLYEGLGITVINNTFQFVAQLQPIIFLTSVDIAVRRNQSGSGDFRAGLVVRSSS